MEIWRLVYQLKYPQGSSIVRRKQRKWEKYRDLKDQFAVTKRL